MIDVNIASALIGGAFVVVVGVILGAAISNKNAYSQENHRLLIGYYAEVFTCYYMSCSTGNTEGLALLAAAIERTKLLCSKSSEEVLNQLEYAIIESVIDYKKCGNLINKLRVLSQEDIRKR